VKISASIKCSVQDRENSFDREKKIKIKKNIRFNDHCCNDACCSFNINDIAYNDSTAE